MNVIPKMRTILTRGLLWAAKPEADLVYRIDQVSSEHHAPARTGRSDADEAPSLPFGYFALLLIAM